ncbi:MAG: O-antigen ligase family protein [Verrucomicrobiales bacterium]
MNLAAAIDPTAAAPRPHTWAARLRAWVECAAFCLLTVPYTTGAMAWGYEFGFVPVRPALFLIAMSGICLLLTIPRKPDFAKSALLIFALLAARVIDAGLLQRFPTHGGPFKEAVSLGATVVLVMAIACAVGVYYRANRTPLVVAAALSVLVCVGVNLAEFAGHGQFSIVGGRAAGFWQDPNNTAMAITFMAAAFCTCSRKYWWNIAILGIAGVGVAVTLSRSGMLVFALTAAAFAALNLRQHFGKLALTAAIAVPLALGGIGIMAATATSQRDSNVQRRLNAIFGGDVDKMGSSERMKDLMDGVDALTKHPIAGMGMGAGTIYRQPHNQIVSVWLDLGIFGAILYGGVVAALLLKSALARFDGLLCVIPMIGFIPFSQFLCDFSPQWYAALIAAIATSARPLSIRLFKPRTRAAACAPASGAQPATIVYG